MDAQASNDATVLIADHHGLKRCNYFNFRLKELRLSTAIMACTKCLEGDPILPGLLVSNGVKLHHMHPSPLLRPNAGMEP